MSRDLRTIPSHLHVRRCVVCGSDDPSLDDIRTERCLCCGCDLHVRPPRSYAEMEDLPGGDVPLVEVFSQPAVPDRRLRGRWMAFLFVAAMLLTVIIMLAAEAAGG